MIRVRFAPSPTGALHIGGLRTALYNYLFAKKNGGKFIIRIEDTDTQRFVPGSEAYIMEALKWCGIEPDEGVDKGGPYAPYRQSERKNIYKPYAEDLIEKGHAYYAFDTAQELENLRKEAEKNGQVFAYNYTVRNQLQTSLNLSQTEVQKRITEGFPYVIRFKIPKNEVVKMLDLIRGEMQVETSTLDDKVLYKSVDQLPTYHLANIVDDHLMDISHVIRGEEWLPSLPLHYLLYSAFNWKDSQPQFAHLPLLLKPQGQGKLSKRDGDKFGFPVFPLQWKDPQSEENCMGYREEGYFPEAVINMLSLLGWNPGTTQELFSLNELCEAFSLEKVTKSGARFNPDKARWFNAQYLKQKPNEVLGELLLEPLQKTFPLAPSLHSPQKALVAATYIASLFKDRVCFPLEIVEWARVLFEAPHVYDPLSVQKWGKEENLKAVQEIGGFIKDQWGNDLSMETDVHILEEKTLAFIRNQGYSIGQTMSLFRLLLIGQSQGPNVFPLCAFMGWEETEKRLKVNLTAL